MENEQANPAEQVDLRRLAGLLSDGARLKVVAALVLGAGSLGEIREQTKLDDKTVSRSLRQLSHGGIVDDDGEGVLRLKRDLFSLAAKGSLAGKDDSRFAALSRNGRLPRSRPARLSILTRLATLFEPGHRYSEAEVNDRLRRINPDFALLRRCLVDEGLMERSNENAGDHTVVIYRRRQRNNPDPTRGRGLEQE